MLFGWHDHSHVNKVDCVPLQSDSLCSVLTLSGYDVQPHYIKIIPRTWAADRLLCACAQKKRKERKWEKEKAGKANMSVEGAETMHLLHQAY